MDVISVNSYRFIYFRHRMNKSFEIKGQFISSFYFFIQINKFGIPLVFSVTVIVGCPKKIHKEHFSDCTILDSLRNKTKTLNIIFRVGILM